MRKDRWVLILGCMAAPLACAQQHAVATPAQLSRPAAPPASRNPIGQALADLLRQARPAPQAPADQAAVAQPASSALAPAQDGTTPQAHADASATSSTPAANAVVVNH